MADDSGADKAAEYRRQAAACLEVANQMSLRADRERMTQMAHRLLDLASAAEGEEPIRR